MTKITIKQEKICLFLLVPANVLYVVALFSHAWFKLPGVSYGLWWAVFCDFLACNIVPAFFTEEPGKKIDVLSIDWDPLPSPQKDRDIHVFLN